MRNKESSGNDSNAYDGSETRGSPTINSVKTNDFLALGVDNIKSNSEIMTTHLEYRPPRIWRDNMYRIWFASEITVVVRRII